MGQVIQVNGDYNIKAKQGATITLDTGPTGQTRVTGNLVVEGDTLFIETEQLTINDNIITINAGETGAGVSLGTAGIEVDRGTEFNIGFIYTEADDAWNIVGGTAGSYFFVDTGGNSVSKLRLKEILTDVTDDGDLILIGEGTGVVKVGDRGDLTGTVYADLVTDPGDIPNKRYVDRAIQDSPTFQIRALDTRVAIRDSGATPNIPDTAGSLAYWESVTDNTETESAVGFIIDDIVAAEIYADRAELFGLNIFNEDAGVGIPDNVVLQALSTPANIKFDTNKEGLPQGGKVQFTYGIQLDSVGGLGNPSVVSNSTVVYARAPSIGTTGVFFVNSVDNGELISKRKALLFSMIF